MYVHEGEDVDVDVDVVRHYLGVKANKLRITQLTSSSSRGGGGVGGGVGGGGRPGQSESESGVVLGVEDAQLGCDAVTLVGVNNQGGGGGAGAGRGGMTLDGAGARAGAHATRSSPVTWNATWNCPGKVTCLEVAKASVDNDVWAGTVLGHVCKITTQIASGDGGDGDETTMDVEDEHQANAFLSVKVHEGVVSSVDVNSQSGEVLSAGYDGRVFIHRGERMGGGMKPQLHHSTRGAVSYNVAKWCSGDVFLTAASGTMMGGGNGGLQSWDRRSKQVKSSSNSGSTASDGVNGGGGDGGGGASLSTILCVDVHPSRPHLCATGHEGGLIALWDLRKETHPFQQFSRLSASGNGFGHVWEVSFACEENLQVFGLEVDNMNEGGGGSSGLASPLVFACTQDGHFGVTRSHNNTFHSLLRESSCINSFDFTHKSMMCVTGQEGLVVVTETDGVAV